MGPIKNITDVVITPLKRFPDERGTVMHMMQVTDPDFKGFAQVYCSTVNPGKIKGWHFQNKAYRSYIVLSGMVKLVLYDEREDSPSKGVVQEIFMGDSNYVRVTIPPQVWSGVNGISTEPAILCDVVNMAHDPDQAKRCDPNDGHIPYDWAMKDR